MHKPQIKILSIDGGGIKGIIPCTILKYIEEKTGTSISRLFHLIAGTSTGGIIAAGLTKEEDGGNAFKASDMLQLYAGHGKDIFSKRPADLKSWLDAVIQDGLFDRCYDVKNFEKLLLEKFGDSRLKDGLTDILVTTYAPSSEKPFYFSSRIAKVKEEENFLLRQVARSTSAAPTFFAPAKVKLGEDDHAFVDGGVFANNPAVLAYGEAKEIYKNILKTSGAKSEIAKPFAPEVAADDNDLPFYMLSIGCGHHPAAVDFSDAEKWRTKDWIQPLLTNVFMQSVAESTHYTMQYLMPPFKDGTPRYQRLDDIKLDADTSAMDDASPENIDALCQIADRYVADNQQTLDAICTTLLQ
ncbi:MAG: patatin-like phospholipase family protein [Bacteroidota bacterium]